jgi:rhomboid protease GluP
MCTDPENQNKIEGQNAILAFVLSFYGSIHTFAAGELQRRYEALQPYFSPPDKTKLDQGFSSFDEAWSEIVSIFTPREGYFITPLLLLINSAVFIVALVAARLLGLDYNSVITLGANSRAATLNGEPWRLVSSVFLHWNFVHLFTNMVALYFIGSALEHYLKKGRLVVVYLVLGVLASVTSLLWNTKAVSAGASGAIFGLYGVFLALLTTNLLEPVQRKTLLPGMMLFIGFNLLGGREENIDSAAHIGGFISGVVIGYFLYLWLKAREEKRT